MESIINETYDIHSKFQENFENLKSIYSNVLSAEPDKQKLPLERIHKIIYNIVTQDFIKMLSLLSNTLQDRKLIKSIPHNDTLNLSYHSKLLKLKCDIEDFFEEFFNENIMLRLSSLLATANSEELNELFLNISDIINNIDENNIASTINKLLSFFEKVSQLIDPNEYTREKDVQSNDVELDRTYEIEQLKRKLEQSQFETCLQFITSYINDNIKLTKEKNRFYESIKTILSYLLNSYVIDEKKL